MTESNAQLLSPADPTWEECLASMTHDVYHRAGWTRAHEILERGDGRALLVVEGDAKLLLPIVCRPIKERWDAVSPYGYPGYITDERDPSAVATLLSKASRTLQSLGAVSLFVRLHPALNSVTAPEWMIVDHGPTVIVNLGGDHGEWLRGLRSGHRYDIRRAEEAGVTISREDEYALDDFCRIYADTMTRVGASDYYTTEPAFFRRLFDLVGEELELWVARLRGRAIAASIFSSSMTAGIAQYQYSATHSDFLDLRPSKAIIASFVAEARVRGLRTLNLGGGVNTQRDSLFNFKSGFSKEMLLFRTARQVLDEDAYFDLLGGATVNGAGYFPAYRDPALTVRDGGI